MLKLSIAEQKLISFANEEFGEFLTRFLLTGLGDEDARRRWRFTITFADDTKAKLKRRVQGITYEPEDGSSCLPRGKDPLVLLSLIQLLIGGGEDSDYELRYDQEDVLKLLGWPDTSETRREIDEAVKRYFMLTLKWGMNRDEVAREGLARYSATEGILSECETIDQGGDEGRKVREMNRVVFNSNFVGRLKRRSLFNVGWDRVTSVSRVLGN